MCLLTFEVVSVDLCGEGWTATGFGTCVKLIRQEKDFHDANEICASHNASLVTLHTQERVNFIKTLIMKESKRYMYSIFYILNNIYTYIIACKYSNLFPSGLDLFLQFFVTDY